MRYGQPPKGCRIISQNDVETRQVRWASADRIGSKTPVQIGLGGDSFARSEDSKCPSRDQAGGPALSQNEAVRALIDSMGAGADSGIKCGADLPALAPPFMIDFLPLFRLKLPMKLGCMRGLWETSKEVTVFLKILSRPCIQPWQQPRIQDNRMP